MKRLFTLLLLSHLISQVFGLQAEVPQTSNLVLRNVSVIDMTGKPVKADMTVIINGNRIIAIRRSSNFKLPKNAQIIDGKGKFLIPGFWDMHVHTLSKGQPEHFFPLFIANGVLGVRDMGGDLTLEQIRQIKLDLENGSRIGPRIIACGPIVEGNRTFWPFSISIKKEGDAKKVVDNLVNDKADFIKVYNSLSRDQYFAVVAEAKQKRISFVGHIPEDVTPLEASRAGQKSIEHLIGIKIEITRNPDALRKQRAAAQDEEDSVKARDLFFNLNHDILNQYEANKALNLFREFARNKTWQTPTLAVLRSYASIHDPNLRTDSRIAYMPLMIRESWFKSGGKPDARNAEMQMRLFEKNIEIVNVMRLAGVKFLAGTDTPNPYTYPGFSLHNELELYVQAGFSPMEALQTATRNPAEFLGEIKEHGTIEKGKFANLMLLDANPLDDIKNTTRINAVILNGKYLSRQVLDKFLTSVEKSAKSN